MVGICLFIERDKSTTVDAGQKVWSEKSNLHGQKKSGEQSAMNFFEIQKQNMEGKINMDIKELIKERTVTHGDFEQHAATAQALKRALRLSSKWHALPATVQESLEMMMHKVARITNGQYGHLDSWHDIQGYAELILQELGDGIPF